MKNIRLSIVVILLFQNLVLAHNVKIGSNKIEISYDNSDLNSQSNTISSLKTIETPGNPKLPYFSFIIVGKVQDLKINLNIKNSPAIKNEEIRAAEPKPCRCNRIESLSYSENKDIYGKNQFWPSKNYEIEYLGDYQGKPLSRLTYYPSRYNPILKETQNVKNVEMSLKNKENSPIQIYDKFDELLVVKNKKYLILTLNKFNSALSSFITWKRKLGFTVDIINIEDIGVEPTTIKSYLKNRYKNDETTFSFLLLVGHEGIFPTFYEMTQYDRNTPSDLQYSLYGDENDYIPDVFYGRMVVDSDDDILHQTQKIINYEKGIFATTDLVTKAVGIASNEGVNPSDADYLLGIEKPFTENRNFTFTNFLQGNEDSNIKNINNQFSNGISWFTYIGHGSGFSWPSITEAEYDNQKIKEMKTSLINPIIIDVACQNGRFKYGSFLGERMMNEIDEEGNPLGAVAYYGGSVDISWDPPAIMATGITKSYVEKNLHFLGQTLLAGQLYLLNNYNSLKSVKENFTWFHLQGDPSLQIRTRNPAKLKIEKNNESLKLVDEGNSVIGPVNITFIDETREKFTTIKAIPDGNGFETVAIPPNSEQVFISAPNYEFVEEKISDDD